MTLTGPQRYPGASTSSWYGAKYPGSAMDVNVVVLHTTEGRTLPSYDGGATAPNLTAVPDFAARRLRWYQHFDIDRSSRALVNLAGGVETNTLNVCQVELVGTCDPATHAKWGSAAHVYWPEAPEWALAEVAAFLRWMHANHGVPLSGPSKWPAYPGSYGSGAGARMSGQAWSVFSGVCGHLHVPENVHGDPGAIDFARLIALAKGSTQEDNVTISNADAKALFGTDGAVPAARPPVANEDYEDGNTSWTAGYALQTAVEGVRKTQRSVGSVAADVALLHTKVDALTTLVQQLIDTQKES